MLGYDDLFDPIKFNSLTNQWSPVAFMPGELSLSMPTPPLPAINRQAIIALLTGNWRALLDNAISAGSQQLWDKAMSNCMPICSEKPDRLPSCDTAGPQEQCYPGITAEDKKLLKQVAKCMIRDTIWDSAKGAAGGMLVALRKNFKKVLTLVGEGAEGGAEVGFLVSYVKCSLEAGTGAQ